MCSINAHWFLSNGAIIYLGFWKHSSLPFPIPLIPGACQQKSWYFCYQVITWCHVPGAPCFCTCFNLAHSGDLVRALCVRAAFVLDWCLQVLPLEVRLMCSFVVCIVFSKNVHTSCVTVGSHMWRVDAGLRVAQVLVFGPIRLNVSYTFLFTTYWLPSVLSPCDY